MVSGAEAYFQEGMRTIYSFCFCMYRPSVLIGERVDVGKRSNFSSFYEWRWCRRLKHIFGREWGHYTHVVCCKYRPLMLFDERVFDVEKEAHLLFLDKDKVWWCWGWRYFREGMRKVDLLCFWLYKSSMICFWSACIRLSRHMLMKISSFVHWRLVEEQKQCR